MKGLSPAEQMAEEYDEVQRLLASIISGLREKRDQMTPAEFKDHLRGIGLDEVAAADFLASDGTVESMTNQMWVYFDSPLKPWPALTA